ncbi:MAG: peptidase U62 [Bryobacterales bacterium]|nr:peptidase U62 [Bryobacterales bacterium]
MRQILAFALVFPAFLSAAGPAGLLQILTAELNRNFTTLQDKAEPKPYFLSYSVVEQENSSVSAVLGAITSNHTRHQRSLDVSIRLGSAKLDNYHQIRGDMPDFASGVPVALDDSAAAIQRRLWAETDRVYRLAAQRLTNINTNREVKVADKETAADDFSVEQPETATIPTAAIAFNQQEWAGRLRKLSARFSKYPKVLSSQVTVTAMRETKYFVSSEGTRLQHGRPFARIMIVAQAKAADGMDLSTSDSFSAADPKKLPNDKDIEDAIDRVARDLTRLLDAPLVEPYVGPAILSGRAAGVFFHEIFGHRIEGHRQKDESDGQTFTKRIGENVLPPFLSVVFDPTLHELSGEDLHGWYDFDDEGVRARRVAVVEQGILKTFLMSRSPIAGFPHSNGHGRKQAGAEAVSRQSNLIVQAAQTVTEKRLREMLIDQIKRQNKPYGYYFQDITGGFTTTGRQGFQAFKVIPLVVYKVYADGREELVRGADLVGTPLASFAKILAAADKPGIFNGYCGAESGSVPVSAISPALLIGEIEIQKKDQSRDQPPLLPAPTGGGAN